MQHCCAIAHCGPSSLDARLVPGSIKGDRQQNAVRGIGDLQCPTVPVLACKRAFLPHFLDGLAGVRLGPLQAGRFTARAVENLAGRSNQMEMITHGRLRKM